MISSRLPCLPSLKGFAQSALPAAANLPADINEVPFRFCPRDQRVVGAFAHINHDACARQHRRLPLALGCCPIDHYGSRISYRNAAEDSVPAALKANHNWRRFPFAGTVREQANKPFLFENAAKSPRKTRPFRSETQPSIGSGMKRAI